MTFHRYVALGDSFTEGVGDPDPSRPNGWRGWADRVAEVLATHSDDFGYANLADPRPQAAGDPRRAGGAGARHGARPRHRPRRRQRRAPPQGRPRRARGGVRRSGRPAGRHRAPGSWCSPSPTRATAAVMRLIRGRTAIFNEWVREIAEKHGATLVDCGGCAAGRSRRSWTTTACTSTRSATRRSRSPCSTRLGVEHDLQPLPPAAVPTSRAARQRAGRPRLGPRPPRALGAPPGHRPVLRRRRRARSGPTLQPI